MSANPHANGGLLLRDLRLPDFRDYALKVSKPGRGRSRATRVQGQFIATSLAQFRQLPPSSARTKRHRTAGCRLRVTNRCSTAEISPGDDHVAPDGRVMEMLSEHQCQGWLEVTCLRAGTDFFSCYEAFIHIVDSMFNQHAKWLKVTRHIPWRGRRLAELSAHVPRVATGPQRFQPPGSRIHRSMCATKRRKLFGCIFRPTRTPCSPSPIIACAAATM